MSPQPPALRVVLIILVTGWVWLAMTGIGMAETGRMTHLGEDTSITPGAHGNPAPVAPSAPSAPVSQGNSTSGALTPFGTPVPPNHLTPAPTLPMNPNRPLSPQQPVAPPPASPPQGFGFSGGGGRFGR